MFTRVWIIAFVAVAVIVALGLTLVARNHRAWVARLTPAGVWRATTSDGDEVLLEFDGGPREGTYRQVTRSATRSEREFGHWAASGNDLRLLIMASERPSHPRFGIDTRYELRYTGPAPITVDGPDRPN